MCNIAFHTKQKIFLLVIVLSYTGVSFCQQSAIVPQPVKLITSSTDKDKFILKKDCSIISDQDFLTEAKILFDFFERATGLSLKVGGVKDTLLKGEKIVLKKDTVVVLPEEGYILDVTGKGIQIRAKGSAGIYYGCMSLIQALAYAERLGGYFIPAMQIVDYPRFTWRGLMLDCSRTFISLEYLKKTIDRMSFYKLNTLHLHLTDDQGWRLQIEEYPLLTSKGSFFDPRYNEPKEFEGFYSQRDIRELIRYAKERHVQIVPEIEVPGHSHAALYAYPELSCSGEITPVFPFFAGPNMTENDVFCAGNGDTYPFFKSVIKEVTNIFPSPYIHLGGDEVGEKAWKDCKKCNSLMISKNLGTKSELQGYVMNRVGEYVTAAGKRPIGWDEVFHTGVGKEWIIMIWRQSDRGLNAVKAGYDVILTPHTNLYFDFDYNRTSTEKVYSFEPIPDGLSFEEEKHYLGIQGSFWNHIDRTLAKTDFQLYPRLLALSERSWSEKSVTDYDNFRKRLAAHRFWFDYFEINDSGRYWNVIR